VARCVAKIYKSLGLLSKGQLIETDRGGLVAGYVGQTAIKTQEVIDRALGGILFIDEAYTLSNGGENDFGQEAIDTLLKAMEDKREDLVVIVAGYEDQMDTFIHSNPGLESRFNRYIDFEDYTPEQLLAIFISLCEKNQYRVESGAEEMLKNYLNSVNAAQIGNGRGVRNIFEKVVTQQARRTELDDNPDVDLALIIADDISNAIERG
jgi:SpoVK/Ycf46/Vps4 family AAA+-type ATPase